MRTMRRGELSPPSFRTFIRPQTSANEYSPNEIEILIADMNHDGNINIQDIILLIQLILNG